MIGGLQGIVDHVMVGHYVGFTGNAAIGVGWQIFLVIVVFISSLFTGMGVLVARFAGAGDEAMVDRTVYQAFLTAIGLSIGIMAPVGYFLSPVLLDLVHATRQPADYGLDIAPYIQYGASPRATIFLARAAKARALLEGRGYVTPHDVKTIGPDVLRHRIIVTYEAEAEDIGSEKLLQTVFEQLPVP